MEHISNHLVQSSKNLAQAKPDLRLPVTSEEESFVVAVNDTKIVYSRQEDIKEVLRLVMVKVGLRADNWPKDEEKAVLLDHIFTNYGGHTPKEILLAFDMALAGKLDVDATTYENFSCLYFSNIMNAYREWAKQTHRQIVKEPPPMIEHKEDLSDKSMQEWLDSVSKDLVEEKIKLDILPVMVYDWLDRKGKIELDTKMKFVYMDAAALRLQQDGESPEVEKVKKLAKRLALNDYILKNHEKVKIQ